MMQYLMKLRVKWEMWRSELPLLDMIEVPRCVKLKEMDSLKKVELHHFLDASTEGYGSALTFILWIQATNYTAHW